MSDDLQPMRHCTLCLWVIPPDEVKVCSKCHRRAYCSRKCQVRDWKPKGQGQGHKNWCGIECGEEGLDFEVVLIEGKGRGLVAKRLFPKGSRIMVDGFRSKLQNVAENFVECRATLGCSILGNHACDPNAHRFIIEDDGLKANVVYAQKDIQPGEEICFNYTCFNDTSCNRGIKTVEEARAMLQSKWGVVCPPDCFCRDKTLNNVLKDTHKYQDGLLIGHSNTGKDADVDLELIRLQFANQRILHSPLADQARLLVRRFLVGIKRKATMQMAKNSIEAACRIYAAFLHPQQDFFLKHVKWMEDPSTHPDYLRLHKSKRSGKQSSKPVLKSK